MFFQKVLKGIAGLTDVDATDVFRDGIRSNWWRTAGAITAREIMGKLDERNLDWHLNHYDDVDPRTGVSFSVNTPYISTTAGVVERDAFGRRNIVFDPFVTALRFATHDFTMRGHVFYAHLYTLGKQSIELLEFAEEVRELNIYKNYMPFHPEGEITAKVVIWGPQIERWEAYDGKQAGAALKQGRIPVPVATDVNHDYARPERYCNIRGTVTI